MHLPIHHTWNGVRIPADERVDVWADPVGGGIRFRLIAPFHGDPPPLHPPGSVHGLWDYEVVELFIVGQGEVYTEVEIGPNGHYLVLRLEGVRNPVASGMPIACTQTHADGRWSATAMVPASLLPAGPWRVNAYAIHGVGGERRYLAHRAPGGSAPDFHRLDCFVPLMG